MKAMTYGSNEKVKITKKKKNEKLERKEKKEKMKERTSADRKNFRGRVCPSPPAPVWISSWSGVSRGAWIPFVFVTPGAYRWSVTGKRA